MCEQTIQEFYVRRVAYMSSIEVAGNSANSVIHAFKKYQLLVAQFLSQEGIGKESSPGVIQTDPNGWYPLEAFLRALDRIHKKVGDTALQQIGLAVPANAVFPPSVIDVHTALQSLDIAYHMNHRKNGEVMFNPHTGKMLEGIGHYGYERVDPGKEITCLVTTPYPCPFDQGIITCMARRFEKLAHVKHVDPQICRKNGDDHCTYSITWF
jgi:hypothetical protein